MSPQEFKDKIARPATQFITGGFRPKNTFEESWIGKVFIYREDEAIPLDKEGAPMVPLAQLYLPNLPYVHPYLENTKLICIFVSRTFPNCLEPMGDYWLIREYTDMSNLVMKDLSHPDPYLDAFPLLPEYLAQDFPIWDGGGLSPEMEDAVIQLEKDGQIPSYYDMVEHSYLHKIGGYPSFCQSGIGTGDGFGKGFSYVLQISSDNKAMLNIVDSGSFMFAKN
ncbi:MAG: hypothetical protein AAFU64_20005, partial [Bacteroidota bacterium]